MSCGSRFIASHLRPRRVREPGALYNAPAACDDSPLGRAVN